MILTLLQLWSKTQNSLLRHLQTEPSGAVDQLTTEKVTAQKPCTVFGLAFVTLRTLKYSAVLLKVGYWDEFEHEFISHKMYVIVHFIAQDVTHFQRSTKQQSLLDRRIEDYYNGSVHFWLVVMSCNLIK